MKRFVLFLVALIPALGFAQQYSIDRYKIAGGGGTSTNGIYSVSGTIGQPDASSAMTGGGYSLTGGFWSLISVVQTAGLPTLTVTHSGNTVTVSSVVQTAGPPTLAVAHSGNAVTVSWPATGSYTLQQNGNLATPGGWKTSGYSNSTANGTNSITITSATGNLFFRLANP
jgi:hypothetical protein